MQIKPTAAHKLCIKATKLKQKGDYSAALLLYKKAIKKDPNSATAYYERADLPNLTVTQTEFGRMQKIFETTSILQDQIIIAFALAKAFDKQKNYAKAFEYLAAANALKKQTLEYDARKIQRDIQLLKTVFNETECQQQKPLKAQKTQPIFIVGMPRSGTTLVEQIVSSHPAIHGAGELTRLNETVSTLFSQINPAAEKGQKLAAFSVEKRQQAAQHYQQGLPTVAKHITHISDKMPHNILHIGFMFQLFNQPKVVIVQREKIATVFSCFQQHFREGNEFSYNLNDSANYYQAYAELQQHWLSTFKNKIHVVQYEQLIANPEQTIKALINYLGVEWNERCLAFEKNKRQVSTLSTGQVRQPIYTTAIEHWRYYEPYLFG